MWTISSRHVTCLLLLGYCRVSYPKSFMPGKVPGHHKFSWPIASSGQKLKMPGNGKWWTIWISMNKYLQTPLSFLHLQGQPEETLGEGTNCPERTSKKTRTLWPHTWFTWLSSVNRLQAHFDANPARSSTFVLQSCVLQHERVTAAIGFENASHLKGCFAWNRW